MNDEPLAPGALRVDRLCVFAFLWASQALVHQEFYSRWIDAGDPLGWLVTLFAIATLLRPRALAPLAFLALTSTAYNVGKWPFVVNHILVETMVNVAILSAIVSCGLSRSDRESARWRDAVVDRFRPVVMTMLVVMYSFAALAKLNRDFIDPEFSCAVTLYGDLVERFPFMPVSDWALTTVIWATIAIEAAIPLLLAFRRTRFAALLIGMPFHLMLGLIGHRTFSALAYALYALFLIEPLVQLSNDALQGLQRKLGPVHLRRAIAGASVGVALVTAGLITSYCLGHYREGIGPLKLFRIPWLIWIFWSLLAMAAYGLALFRMDRAGSAPSANTQVTSKGPQWIWLLVVLAVANGASQYVGLKTETCFTMYSNLRTEGGAANHLFLPALRWANYQDDLVDILDTDHEQLLAYLEGGQLITHFEFRRIVSTTDADFFVRCERGGVELLLEKSGETYSEPSYAMNHTLLARKLLYFRPVDRGEHVRCRH